ncbi:DUF2182 domain-containing protein [Pseudonocardia sichuanensis]
MARATATRTRPYTGTALWVGAGAAWLLLVLPPAGATHHHGVAEALASGAGPPLLVLTVSGAAWLVMVAAMMLPTTVPMVRVFRTVSAAQEHPGAALAAFLAAYFAVWLGFSALALPADLAVHALVTTWPWLHGHEGLVPAGALALAGAVQFSPLTRRCLTLCRDPRAMLYGRYRRGVGGAWSLGVRHGLSCLGCCWALMLVMVAVGVGSLWWMVALTGVMVAEKTTRWGPRLVPVVGTALLLAAFVLAVGEVSAVPGHGH